MSVKERRRIGGIAGTPDGINKVNDVHPRSGGFQPSEGGGFVFFFFSLFIYLAFKLLFLSSSPIASSDTAVTERNNLIQFTELITFLSELFPSGLHACVSTISLVLAHFGRTSNEDGTRYPGFTVRTKTAFPVVLRRYVVLRTT